MRIPLILIAFQICPGLVHGYDFMKPASIDETWNWTKLESLSDFKVKFGREGKNGNLWFINEKGLIEYDGRTITQHPLSNIHIQSAKLYILSDGTKFVTSSAGLIIWKDGAFELYPDLSYGLVEMDIIAEDNKGRIFLVHPERGLLQYKDSRFLEIDIDFERPSSLLIDSTNNLWLVEAEAPEVKVFRLKENDQEIVPELIYTIPCQQDNDYLPRLFEDSNGRVWVIDPDKEDRCYYYENLQRNLAIEGLKKASLWAETVSMDETADGDILFLVRRKLGSFNGKELRLYGMYDYPIPSSPPYLEVLSSKKILLGGVHLTPHLIDLSQSHWKTYAGVNFQCEDQNGHYWFISYDRKVLQQAPDKLIEHDVNSGIIDTPNKILAGRDGSIWVSGAHQGSAAIAYLWNGQWHRSVYPQASKVFSHLAALETADGQFVFGCGTPALSLGKSLGGGVIFEKSGNRYLGAHYPPPAFLPRTATLAERKGDGLYMGEGFVAKNFSTGQLTATKVSIFENQWIDHMLVDSGNNLWVACLGIGIYKYDGNVWTEHGPDQGLRDSSVIQLLEDKNKGGIIVLTGEGFYYFDGSRWAHRKFRSDVPFKRENHTLNQSSDGSIWINYASRSWYLLEGEETNYTKAVFKTIRYLPDSDPPETFANLSSTRFPEGSQIFFEFDGIDRWDDTAKNNLMYSWRMNGKEWTDYSTEREAVLFDTAAGRHKLEVRARDKDGNYDPTPAILEFVVIPPVWKHPAFILGILMMVVFIIVLSYLLFRLRVKAALALDNFKLDFFTNISHELRNPLAVIITPAERLLSEEKDQTRKKSLDVILRNARKMQGMVDQLLQFRKNETGKWVYDPLGGEIMSFLRDELAILEPLWKEKRQNLELSMNPDVFLCSFDPLIVRTIVDNLISNAVKYSEAETVIRMRAEVEASDELQTLTIQVEDEGISIPPHEQEHILMPFYRIKGKSSEVGSGIGLALINQLIKLCGGNITIDSPLTESGKGSRFTVIIPLDHYLEIEDSEVLSEKPVMDSSDCPCILIVEDNVDFRQVLVQELKESFRIIEASDGIDGMELASSQHPDVIISDVMMPRMGGFELCEKLKSHIETSHIPVILLTAKSADEHRIKGLRLGADAYIPKPLNIRHLLARIENLLKSRHELRRRFSQKLLVQPSEVTVTPTDEKILKKAIQIVDENMIDEDFDVTQFSQLMGMSKSSLLRKLKAITDMTPHSFINHMRMKRVASLLADGNLSVSEAASKAGIYNMSYFSKTFRSQFNVLPSEYRSYIQKKQASNSKTSD